MEKEKREKKKREKKKREKEKRQTGKKGKWIVKAGLFAVLLWSLAFATRAQVHAASFTWDTPEYPEEFERMDITKGWTGTVATGAKLNLYYNKDRLSTDYDPGTTPTYTWAETGNSGLVTVSGNADTARVTGIRTGETEITCTIHYMRNGLEETETASMAVDVTNPSFSKTEILIILGIDFPRLEIKGASDNSCYRLRWGTSNQNAGIFKAFGLVMSREVFGRKKGKTTIKADVDGRILTAKVTVINPKINVDNTAIVMLKKGSTQTLKITGLNSSVKAAYTSSRKSVATVTSKGKIKAKGYGTSYVTVKLNGRTYCKLSVQVCSRSIVAVLGEARRIHLTHPKYSQDRRMENKFVDCSSFIWKAYKVAGVYFGDYGYAPTAADEAKWCVQNGKALPLSKYKNKTSKLKPGDIIFYGGANNGRYKNIHHVALYVGNGLILHADGYATSYLRSPWYMKVEVVARVLK